MNPLISYYTYVHAVDSLGNATDSAVTPVIFNGASSTATGSTGGSGGGGFTTSGGGTGGSSSSGGGGGSITVGNTGAPVIPSTPTSTATGTVKVPVTSTGSTTSTGDSQTPTKKPTTPVKTPAVQPIGVAVDTPGFGYVITNSAMTPTTTPSEEVNYTFEPGVRYISIANTINLRSSPNTAGYLVDVLGRNSRVLLVDEQNGWGQVVVHGTTGWVRLEYLRGLQDSDMARTDSQIFDAGYIPEYRAVIAYVRTYSLNLRSRPSANSRAFRQIPK